MNILILSWRGPGHPNSGGAEIATHEHAKAWIKAGHNVTLFTSSYFKSKNKELLDGIQIIRKGNQVLGVHINAFIWYVFGRHVKYDIVVDQFHGIPFITPLYVKTKILAYIHEVAAEVWKKNEFRKPLYYLPAFFGPLIEPIIFKLYRNIDFMTVSDSTRLDLIKYGIKKNNIHVIHNGFTKIKIKNPDKEKLLTFLGALSYDKGVENAINIFSEINKKDDDWRFSIVGKGDKSVIAYLKKLVKISDIARNVSFEGYVTEKKKYEILSRSFCLINTSVHEGWGLVNIEANSVGTPVVGYKVKGIIDSVVDGKTGMLFSNDEPHHIAMEIMKLYSDKKRYEIMSDNSIRWSQKYSWEKSTNESTTLLESL